MYIRFTALSVLVLSFAVFIGAPRVEAAPLIDPLLNGGFEQAAGTTTPNTPGTQAYDWQAFQGGYTRVNNNFRSGSWAIRLQNTSNSQLKGAYQRVDINQTTVKPVFIGGYAKGTSIAKAGNFGASLYVEVHYTDGTVGYWNSTPNFGTFNYRWLGFNTGSAMFLANAKPIQYVFMIPFLANASGTAYFDDLAVTEYDPTQSAVTIMVDDGESNTFTAAFSVMKAKNMLGTVAMPSDFVGTSGYMTQAQLTQLKQAGWEIVSHAQTHQDLTAMTTTQATNEINGSKTRLQQLGYTIKSIAYPFGAYNGEITGLAQAQYISGRAFEQGNNPQGTFPYEVKVRAIVNTTTLAQVQGWLNEAKTNKKWEVFVFHTIANTGDDAYHTTPAQFQAIVNAIAASGVPVKTYDQALTQFKAAQ